MKNPRIEIIYKKLGREKMWGYADDYPIVVDASLKGKKHLEILIHESLHHLMPEATEKEVESWAIRLTKTLWHEKYRRVEDSNDIPLQDGSR